MDWTTVSQDPTSPLVHEALLRYLRGIAKHKRANVVTALTACAHGRSVLDIGFVEHSVEFMERPTWKHSKIRAAARECLGVDISEAGVKRANELGYHAQVVDATSDAFIGRHFDIVVIGDVIEHVENPVRMLRFAARHLREGGQVVVTTPNPFFLPNVIRVLREGTFIANAEHAAWITPTNALELARRSGLRLKSYGVLSGSLLAGSRVAWVALGWLFRFRPELTGSAYEYIFQKEPA